MKNSNIIKISTEKENFLQIKENILKVKNTYEIGIHLKKIIKFINELLIDKDVKEKILNDTASYLKENESDLVSHQVTSSLFDYSKCNHTEYNSLIKIKEQIDKRLAAIIKDDLKPLTKINNLVFEDGKSQIPKTKKIIVQYNHDYAVHENGEEINEIYPPLNTITYGLKYTI